MMRYWLRRMAWVVLGRFPDAIEDRREAWVILATRKPPEDEIDRAVRAGFVEAGVNVSTYADDLDLGTKWLEVLHHAGRKLGYSFTTVAHIKELLR